MPSGKCKLGTLITFEGQVEHKACSPIIAEPNDVLGIAERIKWSGRIWRDPAVSKDEAAAITRRRILGFKGQVYMMRDEAMLLFDPPRIVLIGVVPEAQGRGLAKQLIRNVAHGPVVAGTYSDNAAAIRLYTSLGMKETSRQDIYA